MKRIVTLLSVLILLSLAVGCGGQTAPTPTAVPSPAPTKAQSAVPTATPTNPPAPAQPTQPIAAPTQPPAPTQPAAGGQAQVIEIFMTIYDMRPQEITVKAGSPVHFIITNEDTEEHDLVGAGAKLKSILVEGKQTVEVDWTAPETAGTYEAICSIHREIKPLVIRVVP